MKDNRKKIILIFLLILYSPIIFFGLQMIIREIMLTNNNYKNIVLGLLVITLGLFPIIFVLSIFLIQYVIEKINFIKGKKIEEKGETIIADFAGVTRRTYTYGRVSQRILIESYVYINCTWKNPENNKVYIFKSNKIYGDVERFIESNNIYKYKVYIDKNNLKKYKVDISEFKNDLIKGKYEKYY